MEEREKKDERNRRVGWLTSVGIQLVLLVLFYFIVAWREPFPPIPEYGIELGFTTSAGAPAASSPSPQAPEVEDIEEEAIEETSAETEEVRETTDNSEAQEPAVESQVESPVKVEEVKPQETKPAEEQPEVDSRAVMKPSDNDSEETTENTSDGEEENELDERAIYGSQGTNTGESEGANLALSGWVWDFKPKPDDQSDQSGKIVYKIVVDQDGYLVKIETVTSTVSPSVERKYRQAVEKLTFSKTADYKTANVSTGTITFIIKSR
ncbi:hypothetical protein [Ekhidna sp.]